MYREFTPVKTHSISRNLTLSLFFAFGIVACLTLYINQFLAARQAAIMLETNADEYLLALTEVLAVPLWSLDREAINAIGQSYANNDLFAEISIWGDRRELCFHQVKPEAQVMVERSAPVMYGHFQVGSVSISLTSHYYLLLNRRFFRIYTVTMIVTILVLSLISGGLLRQFLQKPFRQFINQVNAYAAGNETAFTQHIPYRELYPLVAVLRQMGDRISTQMRTLRLTQHAVDKNAIAIYWMNMAAHIIYANEAGCQDLGYTRDELLTLSMGDIAPGWSAQEWTDRIVVCKHQTTSTFEAVHRRKDGMTFPVEVTANYLKFKGQEYIFAFAVDITTRKQAEEELHTYREHLEDLVAERTTALRKEIAERTQMEEELKTAKEKAEAANQAKSLFLANMSHELRTPMHAILGFTQLLQRSRPLTLQQKEYLGIITRSGEHLLMLINDVLDISKIETGRMTVNLTTFDLWQTLSSIEEMIRIRAEKKGVQFTAVRTPDVPRYIKTDEAKLRQVLVNLLGNAVKFTEEGNITLEIERGQLHDPEPVEGKMKKKRQDEEDQSSLVKLQCTISDTGIGIAPEEQENIFAAFERTNYAHSATEGTGLGLTFSQTYVHLLGGDIQIESEVGKGSRFWFALQVEVVGQDEVQPKTPLRKVIGLMPNQPAYRILVVEDDPESRLFLTQLLAVTGFDVREATNGEEALEHYRKWQPHLVWMDMRMPVMDGYTAIQEIRRSEERYVPPTNYPSNTTCHPRTLIIALTSTAFEKDRAKVLALGCDDFVRKPVKEDAIFECLSRHLGVTYRYEKPAQEDLPYTTMDLHTLVTSKLLTGVPPELLTTLEEAADQLNVTRVDKVMKDLRFSNAELAKKVEAFAKEFKYKEIAKMIHQMRDMSE